MAVRRHAALKPLRGSGGGTANMVARLRWPRTCGRGWARAGLQRERQEQEEEILRLRQQMDRAYVNMLVSDRCARRGCRAC